MNISIISIAAAVALYAVSAQAALVGYFENTGDYRAINPLTGHTTFLASAGGGTVVNTIFDLDQQNGIAYRRSSVSGNLTSTNLTTGLSITVPINGSYFGLGVFNHKPIGYFETTGDYREINPLTGQTTFLASAGGGTVVNTIFALDQQDGIAYRRSSVSGNLTTTNLTTGLSITVPINGSYFGLGVFNHKPVGYFETTGDYREIDPLTGQTTFLASAGGGTVVNTIFALDQQNGIAYRRSSVSGNLTTTNLTTGLSTTVPVSGGYFALGVTTVPEPGTFCVALGIVFVSLTRSGRSKG